LTAFQLK